MLAADLILCKILQNKDLHIVKTNGLEGKHFQNREPEFNYIMDHFKQYGNVPDPIVLLSHFPDFDLMQVNESDDFLVNKIFEEYGFTKFTEILPQLNEKLKEDSRVAYEFLKKEMETTLKPHVICNGTDIIANAKDRYDEYLKRSQLGDGAFISTGFKELDEVINGFELGEELVTLVARTSIGKSWIALKFLHSAWLQGKRVGLYSGEMSAEQLGFRFDTLNQHIPNYDLVRGKKINQYEDYINNLMNKDKPPIIVMTQKEFGGKPTVQQIENFIRSNNIEIIGIDQYSLMKDNRACKNDPIRIQYAHIAEDLFALSSELKIPIIGLTQANRDAVKKNDEGVTLENIKESDDISHNSSKCLGLSRAGSDNSVLVIDVIKNRSGKSGVKLRYEWDINSGYFSYLPSMTDSTPTDLKLIEENKNKYAPTTGIHPF